MESHLKAYVLRLKPREDLRKSILQFAKTNTIKAGVIITCVGSLEQLNLRFANQDKPTLIKRHFEILALSGTFSDDNTGHFHISVADDSGHSIGGHLLDDNFIYTTAEIVLGSLPELHFVRETDPAYGYKELNAKLLRGE